MARWLNFQPWNQKSVIFCYYQIWCSYANQLQNTNLNLKAKYFYAILLIKALRYIVQHLSILYQWKDDKKVFSFIVLASEKLEQYNIQCNTEEDRNKWNDLMQERVKAVPVELVKDFEKARRQSLKKGATLSKKSKRLTRTEVKLSYFHTWYLDV